MPRAMTALSSILIAGFGVIAACSSSDDTHAAPISNLGGNGGASANGGTSGGGRTTGGASGNSSTRAGSGNGNDGGAAGHETGGNNGDAGAAGDQPGTIVVVEPGACSETATWKNAASVDNVSSAAKEKLLSITLDELDLAFTRDGALYRAHRDSASASFDAPAAVTLPTGYDANSGVALSNDGLTLVLVSTDGNAFGSVSRADRNSDFGATVSIDAFNGLNERAIQTLEHFAAPVLSADGKMLIFSGFTPGSDGLAVIYESELSNGAWSMPTNLSALTDHATGTGTKRLLPSGLSSDERTLFYFDEGTGKEVARFRDRPDAPLYDSVDLAALSGAAPNAKCDRVYYTASDDVLSETD